MIIRLRYVLPLVGIVAGSAFAASSLLAQSVSERMVGRILLQVEEHGEAWYVNPIDKKRIFMGRPSDAFRIMRERGLGITDANLERIPVGMIEQSGADQDADGLADAMEVAVGTDFLLADTEADGHDDRTEILAGYDPLKGNGARLSFDLAFTAKQAGRILLQVERNGEAWYVNPADQKRYFLGRPADAFAVMRTTGVGISNSDLSLVQSSSDNPLSTPLTPSTVSLQDLKATSEVISINGIEYTLETNLWRDFMPISPPDGKPLIAIITVKAHGETAVPSRIDATRLWAIKGNEIWETTFANEERFAPGDTLEKIGRDGPKWEPGTRVDVVIRVVDLQSGIQYLLKASNQDIIRTD
ncbi:MAG: hypothetical protein AAB855_04065 [Patescibacteria group bacterium]